MYLSTGSSDIPLGVGRESRETLARLSPDTECNEVKSWQARASPSPDIELQVVNRFLAVFYSRHRVAVFRVLPTSSYSVSDLVGSHSARRVAVFRENARTNLSAETHFSLNNFAIAQKT